MERSSKGDSTPGRETRRGLGQQRPAVGQRTAVREAEKSGVFTPSSRPCDAFKVREENNTTGIFRNITGSSLQKDE